MKGKKDTQSLSHRGDHSCTALDPCSCVKAVSTFSLLIPQFHPDTHLNLDSVCIKQPSDARL